MPVSTFSASPAIMPPVTVHTVGRMPSTSQLRPASAGGSGNRSRYETPRASQETPTCPENFAAEPHTSGMPARAAASSAT